MSVLGSDDGTDDGSYFRQRARFDDIDIGELEFLFSSIIFEEIIDEISKFGRTKKPRQNRQQTQEVTHLRCRSSSLQPSLLSSLREKKDSKAIKP